MVVVVVVVMVVVVIFFRRNCPHHRHHHRGEFGTAHQQVVLSYYLGWWGIHYTEGSRFVVFSHGTAVMSTFGNSRSSSGVTRRPCFRCRRHNSRVQVVQKYGWIGSDGPWTPTVDKHDEPLVWATAARWLATSSSPVHRHVSDKQPVILYGWTAWMACPSKLPREARLNVPSNQDASLHNFGLYVPLFSAKRKGQVQYPGFSRLVVGSLKAWRSTRTRKVIFLQISFATDLT